MAPPQREEMVLVRTSARIVPLPAVLHLHYHSHVGYEWLDIGLQKLRGIEPQEVMQILNGKTRRPVPGYGPDGHWVLTIWGRTKEGRPLIVVIRPLSGFDWQILTARPMTDAQLTEFEAWEATR